MLPVIEEAAQEGNIDKLYELLDEYPNLLKGIDKIPLIRTPLHVAVENGRTRFALELMRLKPSLVKKMNPAGLTPMDLALQNESVTKRLIEFDTELIRVKGREGLTPLHHVAKKGNVHLLVEFLRICPRSIRDLTIQGQNAVHLAAVNGELDALNVLIGWLQRTGKNDVLHMKDDEGKTVLHIVAYNDRGHYTKCLINVLEKLHKKMADEDKMEAHEIISNKPEFTIQQKAEAGRLLKPQRRYSNSVENHTEFLISPESILEKVLRLDITMRMSLPNEKINALLVVSAFIITSTYQAVLEPPIQKSSEPFLTINTMTFALSIGIIICLLNVSRRSAPVHLSLLYLYFNYLALVWSQHESIRPVLISSFTFFIISLILLGRMTMALFKYEEFVREYLSFGRFNKIISRLEKQHHAVCSVYSCHGRNQERTN